MTRPKVYITRVIPQHVFKQLSEFFDVKVWEQEETPVPREILESEIRDVDGLFCLLTETVDEALLNNAPNLKVISNMAVGYNNVDVEAASKRGIMVTNTPGVLTETTADLTFALLMATARRLVEASEYLKGGKWKTWSPMQLTGPDIFGATLGIIGMGRIGESVAKRAKGFRMKVLYNNRSRKVETEAELDIQYADLDTILKESDFVCVLTPYTPETKGLIGSRELSLMKKSAILINTARGGIVDEQSLFEALKNGGIWAAGLDVFETEPINLDHPLLTLPNVVAIPHIGSASISTRTKMAELAGQNLLSALQGKEPLHIVNKEILPIRQL